MEIWPTFLSFGTHQGQNTPYVTVNPKPYSGFRRAVTAKKCFVSTEEKSIRHESKSSFYEFGPTFRVSSWGRSSSGTGWELRSMQKFNYDLDNHSNTGTTFICNHQPPYQDLQFFVYNKMSKHLLYFISNTCWENILMQIIIILLRYCWSLSLLQ